MWSLQINDLNRKDADRYDDDVTSMLYETELQAQTLQELFINFIEALNNEDLSIDNCFFRIVSPDGDVLNA